MSERRFLRLSLALPLVLPIVCLGPVYWAEFVGSPLRLPSELQTALGVLGMSFVFGGLPYLLFAGGVLKWERSKPLAAFRSLLLRAPLWFAVVAMATVAPIVGLLLSTVPLRPDWAIGVGIVAMWVGGFSIIVGYLYVAAVFSLRRLLIDFGAVEVDR